MQAYAFVCFFELQHDIQHKVQNLTLVSFFVHVMTGDKLQSFNFNDIFKNLCHLSLWRYDIKIYRGEPLGLFVK
jgi:hypothetical protein